MNIFKKVLNGGGVRVPHHKDTANLQTEDLPIPEMVVLTMQQHAGAPCRPVVQKGDKVYVGTLVGEATAAVSTNI